MNEINPRFEAPLITHTLAATVGS